MEEIIKKFEKDMEWMRRQMEEMVGRPTMATLAGRMRDPGCFVPDTDVFETPDEVIVRVDLPGMDRDRIRVTLDSGILTLSGRRIERLPGGVEKVRRHQMEIDYGLFRRKIPIRAQVSEDNLKAIYQDGVLEIQMQKAPAVRTVPVRVHEDQGEGA